MLLEKPFYHMIGIEKSEGSVFKRGSSNHFRCLKNTYSTICIKVCASFAQPTNWDTVAEIIPTTRFSVILIILTAALELYSFTL